MKKLGFQEKCFCYFWDRERTPEASERLHFSASPQNHNALETRVSSAIYKQAFRWIERGHNLYYEVNLKRSYPDNAITGECCYVVYNGAGEEVAGFIEHFVPSSTGFDDGTYNTDSVQQVIVGRMLDYIEKKNKK